MNKVDAIKQIRLNLKKLLSFTSEDKFGSFTLMDGTNITISSNDIEIGTEVYQLDDQGNQTPLDNGDYVLQDGRTFTVTDNKITDISGPEEDGTDVDSGDGETDSVETSKQKLDANGLPEGHTGEQKEGDKPEVDDQKEGDMSSRLEDLEKQVAELMNIINKMGDSQNDLNEQMMGKLKKFGSEPATKSIKSAKNTFSVYDKEKSKEMFSEDATIRLLQMTKLKKQNNLNKSLGNINKK